MKWFKFIIIIIAWSGAHTVEATSFWQITKEHNNLALSITLFIIWLCTLFVTTSDLSSRFKKLHIV